MALASLQRGLETSAFRDVAGHRELNGASVRHWQRRRMRLHMPPRSLEPDDVELPAEAFAVANPAMAVPPPAPMLRSDESKRVSAAGLVQTRRLDHLEASGVHMQQGAIRGHHLHTFRCGVDDRTQKRFALLGLRLGLLEPRDILESHERAGNRSTLLQRLNAYDHPSSRSIEPLQLKLDVACRQAAAQGLREGSVRPRQGKPVTTVQLGKVAAVLWASGLRAPAPKFGSLPIAKQNYPFRVADTQRCRDSLKI
ncbi:hypothetical protein [Azospirillum doebereinerae]